MKHAEEPGKGHVPALEPDRLVKCDICGDSVRREDAKLEDVDGDVVYYCSVACLEKSECIEIDRGPDPEDDVKIPPSA